MTPEEAIYDDLKRQYDLIADRRKTLTGQATSVTGFAGVIETILIATIVALASDPGARQLLMQSQLYVSLLVVSGIGFLSYMVTVFFSLRAFWEPHWIPAPRLPPVPGKDRFASIEYFLTNPTSYERIRLAQQLGQGIDYNQRVNNLKFRYLKVAFVGLIIGIIFSGIGGIILLLMG